MKVKFPNQWKSSNTILLFKKGDIRDIQNYRPISLTSHLSKLFYKVISNRINIKLEENQPLEQAGFRKNCSTITHMQTVRELIQKTNEYNRPS